MARVFDHASLGTTCTASSSVSMPAPISHSALNRRTSIVESWTLPVNKDLHVTRPSLTQSRHLRASIEAVLTETSRRCRRDGYRRRDGCILPQRKQKQSFRATHGVEEIVRLKWSKVLSDNGLARITTSYGVRDIARRRNPVYVPSTLSFILYQEIN